MRLLSLVLTALLLAPAALAQSEGPGDETRGGGRFPADGPLLTVSAEAHGLSGAGLFSRGADPLRALQNPALLADLDGLALAGSLTPDGDGVEDVGLEGGAVAYSLTRPTAARPLAVVVGAATSRFDYGDLGDADGVRDRASTVALGVGWAGAVPVRAGLGVRTLTTAGTTLGFGPTDRPGDLAYRSRAVALDLGADVTLPVSDWLRPAPAGGPRLAVDVTAGAALQGLTVARSSGATLDGEVLGGGFPLDARTTLTLGASARLGLDVGSAGRPLRAAEVVGMADLTTFEFDADLTRFGARVALVEALTVRVGAARYAAGYRAPTSVGLGVSGGGLLRAVGALAGVPALRDLDRRFDLRYDLASQPSAVPPRSAGGPEPDAWRTHTLVLRLRP